MGASLAGITITDLYRCRWQVEAFFKGIMQHCERIPNELIAECRQAPTDRHFEKTKWKRLVSRVSLPHDAGQMNVLRFSIFRG